MHALSHIGSSVLNILPDLSFGRFVPEISLHISSRLFERGIIGDRVDCSKTIDKIDSTGSETIMGRDATQRLVEVFGAEGWPGQSRRRTPVLEGRSGHADRFAP